MNYWFCARPNELFLDTDSVSKSIRHTRARLAGAIECGKLDVAYIMSRPSKSKDHLHTIVTLRKDIARTEQFVWEIILHGDLYRGCCNLMRFLHSVRSPDILISPHFDFQGHERIRASDDNCNCATKHNAATMKVCPAAIRLRGENRTRGFFGKPSKNPEAILAKIWPMPELESPVFTESKVKEIVERMKRVRKPYKK